MDDFVVDWEVGGWGFWGVGWKVGVGMGGIERELGRVVGIGWKDMEIEVE
nr:hypothetical protein [Siminovitchia fortis]